MSRHRTVVVGGGISGLVCALELERAGHEVVLLEKEDGIGGRVRTMVVDGYTLDQGFQVLFTAYPVLCGHLDLGALALREFLPAARVVTPAANGAKGRSGGGGASAAPRFSLIGDVVQSPSLLLDAVAARHVSMADKLRLLALRLLATSLSVDACFAPRFNRVSTREFLVRRGLSREAVECFFAPFYGGILLDRSLATSASVLLFTFKMLAEGRTAVPAKGMQAIPAQLASRLTPGAVRTGSAVVALEVADGRVHGVRLESGERIEASDVVVAAEPPAAASLAATAGVRIAMPQGALRCTTVYFSASEPPLPGKALWLNAERNATISHAVTLTEVAPEYAPAGRHLLAATAVGKATEQEDATLVASALKELRRLRGGALPELELLAVCHVPYAQYPQPPRFREHRPAVSTPISGLWIGGEALHSSSLEGAARGGRDAAQAVVGARRTSAPTQRPAAG
jgi:phytoene dehydrogenase-like protein